MTKQKPSTKKVNTIQNSQKKAKVQTPVASDLLDIIDNYLQKNQKTLFWTFFAFSILFSFLLFDLRVSVGGDDTTYLLNAEDFIKSFKYPSFQGPLYPIIMSPFIALFGLNLSILKFLSLIFLSAHFFFFYRSFKNNIPNIILFSTLLLLAINTYLLFFGSQTYTEALFLMAQSLFFLWFFKTFITDDTQESRFKKEIPKYLILGLILLGLGLIRSIGYASFFAVILYFVFEKKWKSAGFSFLGFGVAFGIWQLIKFLVWHDNRTQVSHQASTLLLKHPYDPTQGSETFIGFIQRFFDNSNIYLSRQFFKILGLRPEVIEINGAYGAVQPLPILAVLVYAIFIIGFIWAIRKNKYLKFTGIYLGVMLSVTFVVLQTIWEAHRLIITMFPLMIMFIFTGIYGLVKSKNLKIYQIVLPIIIVALFFGNFQRSIKKVKEHQKVLNSQLRGNITAGFTPDWANFINMSIWAAENVPADKVIASRKPSISSIYGKRRFYGIYSVDSNDPDTLLNNLYKNKVEYVIMASLRKNEAQKTDQVINTIQRYLYFIQQKYPEKIKLIQQIGLPDDEPAYLFKIEK